MSKSNEFKMLALGTLTGIVVFANFVYFKHGVNPFAPENDVKNSIKANSTPVIENRTRNIYLENRTEVIASKSDTTFYLVPASQLKIN